MNWLQAAKQKDLRELVSHEPEGSPLDPVPFNVGKGRDPEDRAHEEFMRQQREMGAFKKSERPEGHKPSRLEAETDWLEDAAEEATIRLEELFDDIVAQRIRKEQAIQRAVDAIDDLLDLRGVNPTKPGPQGYHQNEFPDRVKLLMNYVDKKPRSVAEEKVMRLIWQISKAAGLDPRGEKESFDPEINPPLGGAPITWLPESPQPRGYYSRKPQKLPDWMEAPKVP